MAKTRAPLFSVSAHGKIANALIYQKTLAGKICRRLVAPIDRKTTQQLEVREYCAKGVRIWREIFEYPGLVGKIFGEYARMLWRNYTDAYGRTGYHAFMSPWQHRSYARMWQYQLPDKTGFCIVGEWYTGDLVTGGVWIDV